MEMVMKVMETVGMYLEKELVMMFRRHKFNQVDHRLNGKQRGGGAV